MQTTLRKGLLLSTILATTIALSACKEEQGAKTADTSPVVGKYEGGTITLDEANTKLQELLNSQGAQGLNLTFSTLEPEAQKNLLLEVAIQRTIDEEAKKTDFSKDPDINEAIENLRARLSKQKFLMKKGEESVTDAAVQAKYDELKKDLEGKEEFHVRHILVKTEKEAWDIYRKIQSGEDFAKLAEEHSTDTSNKSKGGDLGYVMKGQLVPEFENAAFALSAGQVSQPVKTDFGFHVIRLEENRAAQAAEFDKVKDRIKQTLAAQAIKEYMKTLSEKINVEAVASETPTKTEEAAPAESAAPAKDAAPTEGTTPAEGEEKSEEHKD
ncbi:MAG: prsA [Rickettsiales bacterium]|jgi:parvulin-like peptidyl-prolyl isomerase|nr:prsA [Rickettsiales bacterium]